MLHTQKRQVLRRDLYLALLSAVLIVCSFPKINCGFLAWVALVPLLLALKDKNLKGAFGLSYLMGFTVIMGIFYWINVVPKFELTDFVVLSIFLGSYFGLFGFALNFISRATGVSFILIAPCIWVTMEYAQSQTGFLALPWVFLGYSQFLNIAILQIAAFTGVYGVSFLIVLVNAAFSDIIMRYAATKRRGSSSIEHGIVAPALATAATVLVSFLYGTYTLANSSDSRKVEVAVIQGNIPQNLRWQPQFFERNFEKHIQLTKQAANSAEASLIIWPETSVQGLSLNKNFKQALTGLTQNIKKYVLVGSAERPKFYVGDVPTGNASNSAFLISPNGRIVGRYDKIRLLPFGEYLPYKQFPWPAKLASAWQAGEFEPGSKYTLLKTSTFRFGVTICWENIFPNLFRRFVQQGPDFMVNITNEAWFGETAAPYQFLAMSVLRAVENRISIARSANTGVSGFIDPYGRILGTVKNGAEKDIFVEGYLVKDIPLSQGRTFYTKYGDVFAFACGAVFLIMFFSSILRKQVKPITWSVLVALFADPISRFQT